MAADNCGTLGVILYFFQRIGIECGVQNGEASQCDSSTCIHILHTRRPLRSMKIHSASNPMAATSVAGVADHLTSKV
jgi:hypothetical protein